MKKILVSACLVSALVFTGSHTLAAGLGWLGEAPIRYFSEEDTELMKATVQRALSSNDDGVESEWSNPETGHRGTVTPVSSSDLKGIRCRKAQLFNSAGGREAK